MVGGVEFAMAKEGIVAKKKKPHRKMNSVLQIDAKWKFLHRVDDWHQMTPEAMLEWTAYANTHPVKNRLGQTRYLTGYNWFMSDMGSDDGINLPFDTTGPITELASYVIEGGPYTFTFTWPDGSEDDTIVYISFAEYPFILNFDWIGAVPGSNLIYTKLEIGDLDYAHLSALGVIFEGGHNYFMRIWCKRPQYWISHFADLIFPCIVPSLFLLPMDDDEANPIVRNSTGPYDQTFLDPGGNPNTDAHSVPGKIGTALHFDGIDDNILLTAESYQSLLAENTDFTICFFWASKVYTGATIHAVFQNYGAGHSFFAFLVVASYFEMRVDMSVGGHTFYTAHSWSVADLDDWHHWAMSRKGNEILFYKDGSMDHSKTDHLANEDLSNPTHRAVIGKAASTWAWAGGDMDDFRIYNYALTTQQIYDLAHP